MRGSNLPKSLRGCYRMLINMTQLGTKTPFLATNGYQHLKLDTSLGVSSLGNMWQIHLSASNDLV